MQSVWKFQFFPPNSSPFLGGWGRNFLLIQHEHVMYDSNQNFWFSIY